MEEVVNGTEENTKQESTEQPAGQNSGQQEPKSLAEQPGEQGQEETGEQKQEEAAPVVDDEFVKTKLTELLGDVNNEELTKEFGTQLKEIGITDPDMAEKALRYVCSARADQLISDCAETMQHFGATEDNVTPEYTKAMDEAKTAITAIEAKIPGIKQVFDIAGIQSNLKVVQMLQMVLPYVGEASGGINSNTGIGATGTVKGYAETVFGAYPSERDLNKK